MLVGLGPGVWEGVGEGMGVVMWVVAVGKMIILCSVSVNIGWVVGRVGEGASQAETKTSIKLQTSRLIRMLM